MSRGHPSLSRGHGERWSAAVCDGLNHCVRACVRPLSQLRPLCAQMTGGAKRPRANPSRCRCRETQGPLFALADLNEDVPTRRYWWGETDILRGQEIERLDRLLQGSHERPQPFQTPSPPFPFHRLDSQLSLIVLSFAGALRRLVESIPSLPGSLLVPAVIDRQRVANIVNGEF